MFTDRLWEKVCGWSTAMSVNLPLPVKVGQMQHTLLNVAHLLDLC